MFRLQFKYLAPILNEQVLGQDWWTVAKPFIMTPARDPKLGFVCYHGGGMLEEES